MSRFARREASALRRLWRFLLSIQWYLVGIAGAVTLAFAYVGIRQYCDAKVAASITEPPCVADLSPWDVLYLSLQLFIWQSGGLFLGGDVGRELQTARLFAPAVLGFATIRALIVLFSDQYQVIRARLSRDHVVICGLGGLGSTLASRFSAAGRKVVAIERSPHNAATRTSRVHGAVLVADATDRRTLRKAGVKRAKYVIAACGNDVVNAEVAARVLALDVPRGLTCYVHVADPVLWDRLRVREVDSNLNGGRLQFFNTNDLAARAAAPILFSQRDRVEPPHLLLLGVGAVAERLVIHGVRSWQLLRGESAARFQCSIVDPQASRAVHALSNRYPRVGDVCDFTAYDLDTASPEFAFDTLRKRGRGQVTAACITESGDPASLSAGLALVHASRDETFPVLVCATQEQGLDVLVGGQNRSASYGRLVLFGTRDRAYTPELVLDSTNEILARAIHEEYLRAQERAGYTIHTNPTMIAWETLPEKLRDSNREQADHIVQKLVDVGCEIEPLVEWSGTLMQFTSDEVERMARMEHRRWVDERRREKWRHDPGPKDLIRKTSPYMTEWEALEEKVKDFDRNTVRELPAFLARVGLGVYRRHRGASGPSERAL